MTTLVARADATIENVSPAIRRRRIEFNPGLQATRGRPYFGPTSRVRRVGPERLNPGR